MLNTVHWFFFFFKRCFSYPQSHPLNFLYCFIRGKAHILKCSGRTVEMKTGSKPNIKKARRKIRESRCKEKCWLWQKHCDCGSYFKFTYWSSASLHICKCKWICAPEKLGKLESSWKEGPFEGLGGLVSLSPTPDSRGLAFPEVLLVKLTTQPARFLQSIKPYMLLFIYSLLLS